MRLPFFVHAVIQCITAQLQNRQLRLESAGSIAQAVADDYLHSVQASLADTNATAANTLSQARSEAKRILEQAEQEVQQRWQAFDRKANELLDQYRSTDGLLSEET